MNLNRENMKKICKLMLFAALLVLALLKFDILWTSLQFVLGILQPFIVGGMIAFVINLPMAFFERTIFCQRLTKTGKPSIWNKGKRAFSILFSYLVVILLVTLVSITVIPQLVATVSIIVNKAPDSFANLIAAMEHLLGQNATVQGYLNQLQQLQINWDTVVNTVVNFLKNGMGNMLSSTFTVASSIISGTVNVFISVVFSIYILAQKEKLSEQLTRLLHVYTKKKVYEQVLHVASLLYRNFSQFIIGQCTEAIILGLMFIISMSLLGFDYAVMIGILIAFTSLIPIVGAFFGCFVGAFILLVDDPIRALWFVILFIILQQIEGNLIYPHVVGSSVGLPSIWVLAAVTIGGSLMGVFGMLIFIPLLSTVYMLLREDVHKREIST